MRIITNDTGGLVNGWLMPIWNANESPELRPDQVYATAIGPHHRKGPHLHLRRRGLFAVILGVCRFRFRGTDGEYSELTVDAAGNGPTRVLVPPGCVCQLCNDTDSEVVVLNMPSPAWSAEDQDENSVQDWRDA